MFEAIFVNNKHLLDEQEVKYLLSVASNIYEHSKTFIKIIETQKQEIEYLRSLIK